ncbi:hypothetical protein Tco_0663746, partial [Tanacetum coccineum]
APQSPEHAPLSPVPAPEYPEHLAPSDDHLPAETEPLHTGASPATPPPPRSPHIVVPFSQTRLRRARIS